MDELDEAKAAYEAAQDALEVARVHYHDVIRRLLANSNRSGLQAEIARRTGYHRERLRQIVREAPRR